MRSVRMYDLSSPCLDSAVKPLQRLPALPEPLYSAVEDLKIPMPLSMNLSNSNQAPITDPADNLDELLTKVADRDREAFRAIFDHFAPRLKAYIIGQGSDPQVAEEVVQETMVKIWRKAEQFDPARAAASTWIFTIARNMRIDHLRKLNRPEPDMNDPAFVPAPEPLPSENLSNGQDAKLLHIAIEKLPKKQQDVLRAAYFEEKSHPEIAHALCIPLGTVKSRVRLALKNIRVALGKQT